MNPGGLDALHELHGAGNFAFKRPEFGDLLHERGQPERTDLVEKLVKFALVGSPFSASSIRACMVWLGRTETASPAAFTSNAMFCSRSAAPMRVTSSRVRPV